MAAADLKERIQQILAEEVAPLLQLDPSGLEVVDTSDGIVQVRLHGACAGCPSSIVTLIMSLEQELRQRIPEIEYLEAVP